MEIIVCSDLLEWENKWIGKIVAIPGNQSVYYGDPTGWSLVSFPSIIKHGFCDENIEKGNLVKKKEVNGNVVFSKIIKDVDLNINIADVVGICIQSSTQSGFCPVASKNCVFRNLLSTLPNDTIIYLNNAELSLVPYEENKIIFGKVVNNSDLNIDISAG